VLLPALKLLGPLAAAAALLAHSSLGLAQGTIGLTNVAGRAGDCAAPTRASVCAALFDGTSPLFPGGPAQVKQVRIAYSGDRPAHSLGLYLDHFASRAPASQAMCRAADPADALDIRVAEGDQVLYEGPLSDLATVHGAPQSMLDLPGPWSGGQPHTFSISVVLDGAAGNAYMGCVSTADFVWLASQ
jgi:hypothetical protein